MNLKTSLPVLIMLSACASKPQMMAGVIARLKTQDSAAEMCFTVLAPKDQAGSYCIRDALKPKPTPLSQQLSKPSKAKKQGRK
jgi:hypothetical protein